MTSRSRDPRSRDRLSCDLVHDILFLTCLDDKSELVDDTSNDDDEKNKLKIKMKSKYEFKKIKSKSKFKKTKFKFKSKSLFVKILFS